MKMTFTRPPSLTRTLTAMSELHRHFLNIRVLTGEQLHKAAAIVEATSHAHQGGLLTARDWQNNKHHAAACFELSQKALNCDLYFQSNVQIEVYIDYSRLRRKS